MGRRRGERREKTKGVWGGVRKKKLNEENTWKGKTVGKRG